MNVNKVAAEIVAKGVFARLDIGSGNLSNHIGCAYEVWASEYSRTGIDSAEKDEFRASVQIALESLGYIW